MMSLTFGLFTKVSGSGPLGPLVIVPKLFELLKFYLNTFICLFIYRESQLQIGSTFKDVPHYSCPKCFAQKDSLQGKVVLFHILYFKL